MSFQQISSADIANNSITGADIANNSITGDKIGVGQITANLLAAGAVSTTSISNGNSNVSIVSSNSDVSIFTSGIIAGSFDSTQNFKFNSGYGSVATAYGVRAWVTFNGTGTAAIIASGNITSITDNGTGNFTINFTNALSDENYSVVGSCTGNIADGNQRTLQVRATTTPGTTPLNKTTSGVNVIFNGGGGVLDSAYCSVNILR